jgi:hypothetical protein
MQQMHAGNIEVRARPAGGGARGLCAARATVAPRRPRRGAPHALPALTTPKPSPPAPPSPHPRSTSSATLRRPSWRSCAWPTSGPSRQATARARRLTGWGARMGPRAPLPAPAPLRVPRLEACATRRSAEPRLTTPPPPPPPLPRPVVFTSDVPADARHQTWHLRDSDERACAYIAGQAPCRWGPLGSRDPLPPLEGPILPPPELAPRATAAEVAAAREQRRRHPLYASITLELLKEVRGGGRAGGGGGCLFMQKQRARREGGAALGFQLTHPTRAPPAPAPRAPAGHQQPPVHHGARQPGADVRRVVRGHDV